MNALRISRASMFFAVCRTSVCCQQPVGTICKRVSSIDVETRKWMDHGCGSVEAVEAQGECTHRELLKSWTYDLLY